MSRKVGIITEAPRGSGDEQVFRWLIEQLCPEMQPVIIGNRNKKELINDCIEEAIALLDIDGCESILVIYDRMPRFQPKMQLLPTDPQQSIEQRLNQQGIRDKVQFIRIDEMLETWLIADEAAVRNYLIKKHKPNPVPGPFNGGRKQNHNPKPKDLIEEYLNEYNSTTTALPILKEADLKKVSQRCSSFASFQKFIQENCR